MRFVLDENLSLEIARIARGLGLDVTSSSELGRDSLPDPEQLALAAQDGRCFVTADRGFVPLTTHFAEQQPNAGVLIVPRSMPTDQFARIARALVTFAEQHEGQPMDYLCTFLS